MHYDTYTLERPDHTALVVHRWTPDTPARALIVLGHGYGEHAGRYQHVAEILTTRGYSIDAPDYRGHGKTAQGTFGYFEHFDKLIDDLNAVVERVAAQGAGKPLFLLGHSVGGLLVLDYVLHYPSHIRGLVASAPYVNTIAHVPAVQRTVLRALNKIAPHAAMVPPVDAKILSHDPAIVKGYDADPLVHHGSVSARVSVELLNAGDYVRANAAKITLPALILHGKSDALAMPEFGQTVYDRLGSPDKTIKLYDNFYHEILNELGKEQVMADIVAWLDAHMA